MGKQRNTSLKKSKTLFGNGEEMERGEGEGVFIGIEEDYASASKSRSESSIWVKWDFEEM